MRFINMTNESKITEAIKVAEKYLEADSDLMQAIRQKNDWKYDVTSGMEAFLNLYTKRDPIRVFTWRPFNPWTRAIGFYRDGEININVRKLKAMSVREIASHLLHELTHHHGFHHGNNWKTQDKVWFSLPYFVSEFALVGER